MQALYPDETCSEAEQNLLLSTIRIPKNIMYLSEQLPKPSYDALLNEDENNWRGSSNAESYSLPLIPAQKRVKQKKPSKHPLIANKYRNENTNDQSLPTEPADQSVVHDGKQKKVQNKKYADGNSQEEPQPIRKEQVEEKPAPQEVKKELSVDLLEKQSQHQQKKDGKKSPLLIENSVPQLEVVPQKIKTERQEERAHQDPYIKRLVSLKKPAIKPLNRNIQKIANIYSGNSIEQIISMHKR